MTRLTPLALALAVALPALAEPMSQQQSDEIELFILATQEISKPFEDLSPGYVHLYEPFDVSLGLELSINACAGYLRYWGIGYPAGVDPDQGDPVNFLKAQVNFRVADTLIASGATPYRYTPEDPNAPSQTAVWTLLFTSTPSRPATLHARDTKTGQGLETADFTSSPSQTFPMYFWEQGEVDEIHVNHFIAAYHAYRDTYCLGTS